MSELEPTRTYSNPTATDVLRRLLDERGVEWKAWDGTHPITVWHGETYLYEFIEYRLVNGAKQVSNCPRDNDGHCELTIKAFNCTPEQAIAATLGDADATGERQRDAVEVVRCRDCKHGHITVNGKSCKWCDLIATHDPDGCEPYNGYDPEPYFDADFFCAWGERKESE